MISTVIIAGVVLLGVVHIIRQRNGDISPSQARELLAGGGTLVDVRSPEEFRAGHLPDAINAPVQQLTAHVTTLKKRAKKGPVIVYCLSGGRSALAKRILSRELSGPVRNLGAMSRW